MAPGIVASNIDVIPGERPDMGEELVGNVVANLA
jgi:hypothetical protein